MADVDTVLGLDIGSSAIKAAYLVKGVNGYAARLLAIEPVERQDAEGNDTGPEAVADALQRLVETYKLKGTRCAVSVAGPAVAPRYFSFPMLDSPEQIEQAVKFEAAEVIPFDISECLIDWQIFDPEPQVQKTEGIVIAARREYVDMRYELVKSVGLLPVIVDVDGLALTNAFLESGGGAPPERPTLVVNIGCHSTNLAIITPNGRSYVRDIAVGGESLTRAIATMFNSDIAEAENLKTGGVIGEPNSPENLARLQPELHAILSDGAGQLITDIRDSVGYFTAQRFFAGVEEVWITGGAANFPGLPEYLGQAFGVPTTGWNPLQDISLAAVEEGRNPARADALGPRFAVALGLAMRPDVG